MKNLRIRFDDLPPRPERIDADELRHTFGGCADVGEPCDSNHDCCSGNCRKRGDRGRCAERADSFTGGRAS